MATKTLPETLRALLERAGLSQRRLARDANISVYTMNRWAMGKSQPTLDTLQPVVNVLAEALGEPPESLGLLEFASTTRAEGAPVPARKRGRPRKVHTALEPNGGGTSITVGNYKLTLRDNEIVIRVA